MNLHSPLILILENCVKLTGVVRLTQFVFWGVIRGSVLSKFFVSSNYVKITIVVSLTQQGGSEQMKLGAMGVYLAGICEHAEFSARLKQ